MLGCKKSKPGGGNVVTPPPVVVPPPPSASFAKGADVSWTTQQESVGRKFYNAAGTEMECMALMKSLGMNTIRLRVWVNPSPAWNNTADVLAKAIRAKDLGMRIMINFHYSDSWADPGKQTKPAAWASLDQAGLRAAITTHTTAVLNELKRNNITPEWVQVGNETNDGMLWPEGRASANSNANMANFAAMINVGYDAVKAVFPQARVIVHLSNGWNNGLFRWMFDGLRTHGAKYDVIGMSLYPATVAGWATTNAQCLENMNDMIARYNKEVMVLEVGMPWDSPTECRAFLNDIMAKTRGIASNKGLGVLYWEPQSYGNWQGYTLGAFDNSGRPTLALDAFK
ncbi:MAG: arabinogalactan endo-1,4-beta-galactosidase [Bacteroidetes bacterium]|nr:MAG: arabinogalactan endo-1,4-beta-galactosidase [Bacteroidota bacterium]